MRSPTILIALVLVIVALIAVMALPDLFVLIRGIESETTGISPAISGGIGRFQVVLFVVAGLLLLSVFTVGARR